MFEQLFQRPTVLRRHRAGPLAVERLSFLRHLADQGMKRSTLRIRACYLLQVVRYLRLNQRPDETVTPEEIRREANRWAARKECRAGNLRRTEQRFFAVAAAFLQFQGRLEAPVEPDAPYEYWIKPFAEYLLHERYLAPVTVEGHCRYAERFLQKVRATPRTLAALTLVQVDRVLKDLVSSKGYARNTIHHHAGAVRAFLRYAHRQGWTPPSLAEGIFLPRLYRHETPPKSPSWEVVQRVIAQTQGDRPRDLRDRAILLLLATYGLRRGEIVRLRLEDFDWRNERLTIGRSKNLRTQTFPLCLTVGNAVARYLREARPQASSRAVFFKLWAPIKPITGATVTDMVRRRFRKLGEELPDYGPHSLRHACATHLLEQGVTLKEIGDHLGHCDPDATRHYAQVNVDQLRRVADVDLADLAPNDSHRSRVRTPDSEPSPDGRATLCQLRELAAINLGDLL